MLSPMEDKTLFTGIVICAYTVLVAVAVLIFLRALSTAITGLFFNVESIKRQQRDASGTVIAGLDLISEITSNSLSLLSGGVWYAIAITWFFVGIFLLTATIYIMYVYFPFTLGAATQYWNENFGHFWEKYVLEVANTVRMLFERAVGLYNILVFVLFKIPVDIALHMVANGFTDLYDFAEDLAAFCAAVVVSLGKWGDTFLLKCDPTVNGVVDLTCFDADLRQLDVVTPLTHINKAVLHIIDFIPRTCTVAAMPAAGILYPLTDIEMSRAAHFFVNAILHTIFTAPILSTERFFSTGRVALWMPDMVSPYTNFCIVLRVSVGICE
jgi:hypothetical protein